MVIASTPGWLVIRQTTQKNGVLGVWPGWAFDGAALPRIGLGLRLLAWNTFKIACQNEAAGAADAAAWVRSAAVVLSLR